jgi:hypothetical protein
MIWPQTFIFQVFQPIFPVKILPVRVLNSQPRQHFNLMSNGIAMLVASGIAGVL